MKHKVGVVTACVGGGLFAARLLGEVIPDSMAASVTMFVAGGAAGFLLGFGSALGVVRARSRDGAGERRTKGSS